MKLASASLSFLFLLSSCGLWGEVPTEKVETIIDHTKLNAAAIPSIILDEIRLMDLYFEHASVGENVMNGLEALRTSDTRYTFTRGGPWVSKSDTFNDSTIADWFTAQDGFGDNARGNPDFQAKADRFASRVRSDGFASLIDVAMFKFCYIDSPSAGEASASFELVRGIMESLENDFPATRFVWWTMPIETIANAERQAYNNLVRDYCKTNGKWLLDIAAIESHDDSGNPVLQDAYELLAADYTDDGGHLNEVGAERVARAWWSLLAGLSGWEG